MQRADSLSSPTPTLVSEHCVTDFGSSGFPAKRVRVDTIAGFALRYATAFPGLSGCKVTEPEKSEDYRAILEAASRVCKKRNVREVIKRSYSGVYVDEYQDCSQQQHQLIMVLADLMPCRIVGDPLQGIFGFETEDKLVDWDRDVFSVFRRLPNLEMPYRWIGRNDQLGKWLLGVRKALLTGGRIDLSPYRKAIGDDRTKTITQIAECKQLLNKSPDSVVVIRKWEGQAHGLAKSLKGAYKSMEEIECRVLIKYCRKIENAQGAARAAILIEFCTECMTKTPPVLAELHETLRNGQDVPAGRLKKYAALKQALSEVVQCDDLQCASKVIREVANLPDTKFHRLELFREMESTISNFDSATGVPLHSVGWKLRDGARRFGRRIPRWTVARTLLIKGLEFDHVLLPDVADFDDAKNLYVALTRGSKSLTVLSTERHVTRPRPATLS